MLRRMTSWPCASSSTAGTTTSRIAYSMAAARAETSTCSVILVRDAARPSIRRIVDCSDAKKRASLVEGGWDSVGIGATALSHRGPAASTSSDVAGYRIEYLYRVVPLGR